MIIHNSEPCISCEHYSSDDRDDNHWVCDFDHDTCPHVEELHKTVGYKKQIEAEVLDKIRSEITAIAVNGQVDEHTMFIRTGDQVKQMVLEIIDKYIGGSDKEW